MDINFTGFKQICIQRGKNGHLASAQMTLTIFRAPLWKTIFSSCQDMINSCVQTCICTKVIMNSMSNFKVGLNNEVEGSFTVFVIVWFWFWFWFSKRRHIYTTFSFIPFTALGSRFLNRYLQLLTFMWNEGLLL